MNTQHTVVAPFTAPTTGDVSRAHSAAATRTRKADIDDNNRTIAALMMQAAINDADGELAKLIAEQAEQDTTRADAEYLGGNGLTHWHHCKGTDKADKLTLDAELDGMTPEERDILQVSVTQHQDSIEANGLYIVRDTLRWKGGYTAEKAATSTLRKHNKALGIKEPTTTKAGRCDKDRLAGRKARRLKRMAARRG